jgi:hypothetical protein
VGGCWGGSPAVIFFPAPGVSLTTPTNHAAISFTVKKKVLLYHRQC